MVKSLDKQSLLAVLRDYSGCLAMIVLFIGFIAFLFVFNNKENKQYNETIIGKYVYLDTNETLHAHRHCTAIGKQAGELGSADRSVTRISIDEVDISMLDYTCSRCVNDETYEQLLKMVQNE